MVTACSKAALEINSDLNLPRRSPRYGDSLLDHKAALTATSSESDEARPQMMMSRPSHVRNMIGPSPHISEIRNSKTSPQSSMSLTFTLLEQEGTPTKNVTERLSITTTAESPCSYECICQTWNTKPQQPYVYGTFRRRLFFETQTMIPGIADRSLCPFAGGKAR
jgi:hypothetical protein